jgi:hypothetical protein
MRSRILARQGRAPARPKGMAWTSEGRLRHAPCSFRRKRANTLDFLQHLRSAREPSISFQLKEDALEWFGQGVELAPSEHHWLRVHLFDALVDTALQLFPSVNADVSQERASHLAE